MLANLPSSPFLANFFCHPLRSKRLVLNKIETHNPLAVLREKLLKMAILYDFEAALKFQPGVSRLPDRKDVCVRMIYKRNHLQGLYYLSKGNLVE